MKMPRISTAEEIRTLAARAIAVLDALGEVDDDNLSDAEQRQNDLDFHASIEALRFCAAAAASLGDASLLPVIARALDARDGYRDDAVHDSEVLANGVGELIAAGAPVNSEVEALAAHKDPFVRMAVAKGLKPRNAAAIALLEKLAVDPVAEVRRPAQASLSKAREVPWWMGKFKQDPAAALPPEEAERLKDTFAAIAALIDQGNYAVRKRQEELVALASKLPDHLAVEVAMSVLCGGNNSYDTALVPLGAMMVARQGGVEALIQACETWAKLDSFMVTKEHVQMVASTPPEVRLPACLALARYVATRRSKQRREFDSAACVIGQIAAGAYPPGADLNPLLDIVLAIPPEEMPDDEMDHALHALGEALSSPHADPGPIAERLVEARLAGYPGGFRKLTWCTDILLQRIDRGLLRRAAEEAIQREDKATMQWGIERLLFDVYDPERDPEPRVLAERFYEDPRMRRVVVGAYEARKTVLPLWRADMRRGALDFDQCADLVSAVDDLWGPCKVTFMMAHHAPGEREERRRRARERLAAYLGPEELQGPVTEEEWRILRAARSAFPRRKYAAWRDALWALPLGPWHPEDRALLEEAMRYCEEEDRDIAVLISNALANKPDVADLPLFEKLMRLCPGERGDIRRDLVEARAALGLAGEEDAKGGSPDSGGEWMDEEEDDDDEL
jgi:hypothetical protein